MSNARPPFPECTPAEMAREVAENPDVAEVIFADRSILGFCVVCSAAPILFFTPVPFCPCPGCLPKRLRRLMEEREDLPWWVEYLVVQCEKWEGGRERSDRKALSVDFADLVACHACGTLLLQKDARYPVGEDSPILHPHCVDCYERGVDGGG